TLEELPPLRLERVLHALPAHEWVPINVVVEVRCEVGPRHDRRSQQRLLQRLERAMVDHLLALAGEGIFVNEVPCLFERDVITDDLDVLRIADAEPLFVGETNEIELHWVEALELGADRIDRDLVSTRQKDVL